MSLPFAGPESGVGVSGPSRSSPMNVDDDDDDDSDSSSCDSIPATAIPSYMLDESKSPITPPPQPANEHNPFRAPSHSRGPSTSKPEQHHQNQEHPYQPGFIDIGNAPFTGPGQSRVVQEAEATTPHESDSLVEDEAEDLGIPLRDNSSSPSYLPDERESSEDESSADEAMSDGDAIVAAQKAPAAPSLPPYLTHATPNRLYSEWRESHMGASYPAYGALIPEGYEKSSDRQCAWKCPVRFCDSMFAEINQLGIHFKLHRDCLLHDNCDGTFSVVGHHTRLGAVTAAVISKEHNLSERPSTLTDNAKQMWRYLCSFVRTSEHQGDQQTPVSNIIRLVLAGSADMMKLMNLPQLREIKWNLKEPTFQVPSSENIKSLLIQATGDEANVPCRRCQDGTGPYASCVVVSSKESHEGFTACANCFYAGDAKGCNFYGRKEQTPEEGIRPQPIKRRRGRPPGSGKWQKQLEGEDPTMVLMSSQNPPPAVQTKMTPIRPPAIPQHYSSNLTPVGTSTVPAHMQQQQQPQWLMAQPQNNHNSQRGPPQLDPLGTYRYPPQQHIQQIPQWYGQGHPPYPKQTPIYPPQHSGYRSPDWMARPPPVSSQTSHLPIQNQPRTAAAPHLSEPPRQTPVPVPQLPPPPRQTPVPVPQLPPPPRQTTTLPRGPAPVPPPTKRKTDPLESATAKAFANVAQLEVWEKAPGRIRSVTSESTDNIAFSRPYLRAGREIRVCEEATFYVQVIRPGSTHKFAKRSDSTRLCSIASGKLHVMIEGEPVFILGMHGMFKVKPDFECVVGNESAVDVVLHVTCLLLEQ